MLLERGFSYGLVRIGHEMPNLCDHALEGERLGRENLVKCPVELAGDLTAGRHRLVGEGRLGALAMTGYAFHSRRPFSARIRCRSE